MILLVTGHFAHWTVCLLDISPTTWTVCLQIAYYAYKTARIKSSEHLLSLASRVITDRRNHLAH